MNLDNYFWSIPIRRKRVGVVGPNWSVMNDSLPIHLGNRLFRGGELVFFDKRPHICEASHGNYKSYLDEYHALQQAGVRLPEPSFEIGDVVKTKVEDRVDLLVDKMTTKCLLYDRRERFPTTARKIAAAYGQILAPEGTALLLFHEHFAETYAIVRSAFEKRFASVKTEGLFREELTARDVAKELNDAFPFAFTRRVRDSKVIFGDKQEYFVLRAEK